MCARRVGSTSLSSSSFPLEESRSARAASTDRPYIPSSFPPFVFLTANSSVPYLRNSTYSCRSCGGMMACLQPCNARGLTVRKCPRHPISDLSSLFLPSVISYGTATSALLLSSFFLRPVCLRNTRFAASNERIPNEMPPRSGQPSGCATHHHRNPPLAVARCLD